MKTLPSERWAPIKKFPGHRVSTHGRIICRFTLNGEPAGEPFDERWALVAPTISTSGYLMYSLVQLKGDSAKRHAVAAHRLVLETFVGPCPTGMQCRHLNNDKADPRLWNLRYGTPSQNANDPQFYKGRGDRLKPSHIAWIRRFRREGKTLEWLASAYQTTTETVEQICRGERGHGRPVSDLRPIDERATDVKGRSRRRQAAASA